MLNMSRHNWAGVLETRQRRLIDIFSSNLAHRLPRTALRLVSYSKMTNRVKRREQIGFRGKDVEAEFSEVGNKATDTCIDRNFQYEMDLTNSLRRLTSAALFHLRCTDTIWGRSFHCKCDSTLSGRYLGCRDPTSSALVCPLFPGQSIRSKVVPLLLNSFNLTTCSA